MKKWTKTDTFYLTIVLICLLMLIIGNIARATSLKERATSALEYAKKHNLNTRYAIFVDYSIPSGTPRLFVWDFRKGKVIAKTYVMHGSGGGSTKSRPKFSNRKGSECSSLGKFKIHKTKHGYKIRRSFRVSGLEKTNFNAFQRGLMIHRSIWVDTWNWRKYIPLHRKSCQGCFTVGTKGMNYLEKLIKKESKSILLWAYA